MADCECLPKCPFFNDRMEAMPSMNEIYKEKYCHTDNSACARYLVLKALGRERVPLDLYPHQVARAEEIIAQG